MDPKLLRESAGARLSLVLGFFPRVESRLTLVLGVNLSMLALLVSAAPPLAKWNAAAAIVLLPVACIVASLYYVWRGLFPDVRGGTLTDGRTSLVFFGTIAARTEIVFVADAASQTEDDHTRDLFSQVWINSKILSIKFESLRVAFLWMLVSIIPWMAALGVFASMNPDAKTLLR
jgi:hypothetical protein